MRRGVGRDDKIVRVTTILAVANQKGGVAKTTTVASLGAALAASGRRVLVVDLDPQGSLTFSLGHNPDKLTASVHEVLTAALPVGEAILSTDDGVDLLPATIDLAGAEALLLMRPGREYTLKRALAPVAADYDVVLLDCPPSLGVLTLNGLTAATEVLVPLQCETLAHRGVGQLLTTVEEVRQITNPDLELLGALATLFDARTTHSRDVLADVSGQYDIPVVAPPIPRTVRFAEASASGTSVISGRKNKGAEAYRELARNLDAYWTGGAALQTYDAE